MPSEDLVRDFLRARDAITQNAGSGLMTRAHPGRWAGRPKEKGILSPSHLGRCCVKPLMFESGARAFL